MSVKLALAPQIIKVLNQLKKQKVKVSTPIHSTIIQAFGKLDEPELYQQHVRQSLHQFMAINSEGNMYKMTLWDSRTKAGAYCLKVVNAVITEYQALIEKDIQNKVQLILSGTVTPALYSDLQRIKEAITYALDTPEKNRPIPLNKESGFCEYYHKYCAHLGKPTNEMLLRKLFQMWPKKSPDFIFPVPHPDQPDSCIYAKSAYMDSEDLWDKTLSYNQLRIEMLRYIYALASAILTTDKVYENAKTNNG